MKVGLAQTGVHISDGATNIMPVGHHRAPKGGKLTANQKAENTATVHRAWKLAFDDNNHSLMHGYYQGWAIRIKYAYFQYTTLRDHFGTGSNLAMRVGSLHNVVIDYEEGFWPRYLQQVGLERAGFFSSADVGVAGLLTLGSLVAFVQYLERFFAPIREDTQLVTSIATAVTTR